MCTVTYVPNESGFMLTSSRDEQVFRSTRPPEIYHEKGLSLLYPRDEEKGGTWMATDMSGRTACLLNGAFEKHERKFSYRKSRGLILLNRFEFGPGSEFAEEIDLRDIEPFTLLLLDEDPQMALLELVWDGDRRHIRTPDPGVPRIWSSSTLYEYRTRAIRRNRFERWIEEGKTRSADQLIRFHATRHHHDPADDIVMHRSSGVQTVSITQYSTTGKKAQLSYLDLKDDKEYITEIPYEPDYA